MAAGDYAGAESALIGNLTTSEQMGMVREMLSIMTRVAKIRAATGQKVEAVELLSTVLAEPASAQRAVFDGAPISDGAAALLDELQAELEPGEFEAAQTAGASKPYDVAAKELVAKASTAPSVSQTRT